MEVYYNIIKLTKQAYYLEGLFLLNLFLITSLLSAYIIPFIRLNGLKFKSIFKEKGLDGEINSIPLVADTLLDRILGNILIIGEILIDYTIECIIYYRVISNNSSELSKNPVLLQQQKESNLLLVSAISYYRTKSKKSFYPLLLTINKVGANSKEKVVIQRGLDINREINTY